MTEGVKRFLQRLGLVKHYDIFSAKGFDLETDIPHLSPADLKETLMVSCEKEIEIILSKAKQFKASPEHHLYEWLRRNSLDHYFVNFVQSELTDLDKVSNLKLPNVELYDELEIVLPGHKKRLERAVVNLRQEIQRRSIAEKPVTQGWWGKPGCLPQAKFDFLCVEGTVFAPHEPDKQVKIDFMVDSGSDISTMQEEKLESLNLELVGPIYSCGIHGGNYTNLYRARLQIGQEQLTIEVIASNYDSLGSRIVRHFRHVIDGNRHIWLKGNYRDTTPPILPLKIPAKASQVEGQQQLLSIESQTPEMNPPADKAFRVPATPLSPPRLPQRSSSSSTHPPNLLADNGQKPPPPPTHSKEEIILSKDDQSHTHTIDNHASLQESKPVFSQDTASGDGRQPNCVKDSFIGNNKQNTSVTNAAEGLSSLSSCDNSKVKNEEIGVEGESKRRLDSSSSASNPRPPKMNKMDFESSEIININGASTSNESKFPSENSDHSSIRPIPSHSVFAGASSSSSSRSDPGDTGDDVDHMDSELLYDFLSSASASSMSSHNYNTSSGRSQMSEQFKFFDSNSILTAAVKPNQKPVLEDDDNVIHIDNDDVIHIDNDEDDDSGGGGGGEIDFMTNENTLEKESFVDLGNNFMRGSNTSSVTIISAIDLKEFQMNGNGKGC